jgi:hypothetical protein
MRKYDEATRLFRQGHRAVKLRGANPYVACFDELIFLHLPVGPILQKTNLRVEPLRQRHWAA